MKTGLTPSGWIFVVLAWGSIFMATSFCFWRVLKGQYKKGTE
ncbi:MAG: hypothetical protein ABIL68_06900 [bacterium]